MLPSRVFRAEFAATARPRRRASPLLSVLDGDTGFRIMRSEPVDDPGAVDVEAEPIWAIEPTSP